MTKKTFKVGDIVIGQGHMFMIAGIDREYFYYVETPPFEKKFKFEELESESLEDMDKKFWKCSIEHVEKYYSYHSNIKKENRKDKLARINNLYGEV